MGFPLGTPQIGTVLQKLLRLQGRVRMEMEPFIIPTIQVGDLSIGGAPPEVRRATATFTMNAVAGERFTFSFETPASILAHIRYIWAAPAAADRLIGIADAVTGSTAGFTAAQARFQDTRINQSQGPGSQILFGTQAAALTQFTWREGVAALEVGSRIPIDWYIGGDRFSFASFQLETPNALGRITVEWDEYQLV